jgi:KDO2-lipid IV(A) lauroyltransferase
LLYLFSDFVCFFVYTIFGYRKKVVRENIALTLPHLSEKERLNIEKKFYHYMCDMFLEMVKTMSISQKEMEERFVFTNLDLYLDLEKKEKSIAFLYITYWSVFYKNLIYLKYKQISNVLQSKKLCDDRDLCGYIIKMLEPLDSELLYSWTSPRRVEDILFELCEFLCSKLKFYFS